ncbi:MAG: NB-ARC domain-containing protein, partial [Dolichospermum sp.]
FNVCNYPYQNLNKHQKNSQSLIFHDLTSAPQVIHFYNRNPELEKLSKWLLNQNIRLISVLGLSGIGKTTLVKKFVDLNLEAFQIIIWKNLKFPNALESLFDE